MTVEMPATSSTAKGRPDPEPEPVLFSISILVIQVLSEGELRSNKFVTEVS